MLILDCYGNPGNWVINSGFFHGSEIQGSKQNEHRMICDFQKHVWTAKISMLKSWQNGLNNMAILVEVTKESQRHEPLSGEKYNMVRNGKLEDTEPQEQHLHSVKVEKVLE